MGIKTVTRRVRARGRFFRAIEMTRRLLYEEQAMNEFALDLGTIGLLDHSQKQILRQMYPNLPAYTFMSPAEKKDYFAEVTNKYFQDLSRERGSSAKKRERIRFSEAIQVKSFDLNENAARVNTTKSARVPL